VHLSGFVRSTFLDLDLFHLENSRTLLNDGTGSPVEDGVIVKTTEVPSLTPIEVAADAIAGGKDNFELF